jgi:hypothetical protein
MFRDEWLSISESRDDWSSDASLAGASGCKCDRRNPSVTLPLPTDGNPAPGPKFDYKLAWFEGLHKYGKTLIASDATFIMAGDYNVMPTDLDVYAPERWRDDALFRPEVRKAYAELVKLGWQDASRHLYPGERIYTFWKMLYGAYVLGVTETRQPRRRSRRL